MKNLKKVSTDDLRSELAFRERVKNASVMEKWTYEFFTQRKRKPTFEEFLRANDEEYQKNHGED